jgi:hypothetical protein
VLGSAVPGSGGGTRRSFLAPRFERKAAAEAEKQHFYYEGEFCEAEDLPNGFTKIRNVNLVRFSYIILLTWANHELASSLTLNSFDLLFFDKFFKVSQGLFYEV